MEKRIADQRAENEARLSRPAILPVVQSETEKTEAVTFADFCRSLGIIPPDQFIPGRWQRTATMMHPGKRNGCVKLDESGAIGYAQDWAIMTECEVWRVADDTKPDKLDNAALNARLAARRAEEIRGTMRAQSAYSHATELRNTAHPYLEKKRLTMEGCRGLKVDNSGWLLVPMYRDGKFLSVQRISAEGEKRNFTGAPVKGATYRIWRPGACMLVLCEGIATGLTIFAAMGNANVDVCFSAANLIEVAKRGNWEGLTVAVAGDYDRDTAEIRGFNPGLDAARAAADAIGCGYAVPEFCDGTDFDDLFRERLERIETAENEKRFRAHPAKMRAQALVPIRLLIMEAAKYCQKKI